MEHNYRNIIPHVDIDRSIDAMEFFPFEGLAKLEEFRQDIESSNDKIELHLIETKAYREALTLKLKDSGSNDILREFLREEQKTFGGSKIFYMNTNCSKLLVLGVPNEMKNKLNMVVARVNKVNERISRMNSRIKKENSDLYSQRIRDKSSDKLKDEIINFINQNLKV